MERLLKDAQELSGIEYDISNLSDVYEAIHVIQEEIGITGTTALEAEETISGSISMLKASWDNFLNGSGDIGTVVENFTIAFQNISNAALKLIPTIITSITENMPTILEAGGNVLGALVQGIIDNLPKMIDSALKIIESLLNGIVQALPKIVPIIISVVKTVTRWRSLDCNPLR